MNILTTNKNLILNEWRQKLIVAFIKGYRLRLNEAQIYLFFGQE